MEIVYNLLLDLDRYSNYTSTSEEIQELFVICGGLQRKYIEEFNLVHNRVRKFYIKFYVKLH
jgi:hypothetical protein